MTIEGQLCPTCRTPLPAAAHFCLNCGTPTPTEPGVPARTMPTGAIEVSRIRSALADRYRIEHVLGEGGMATVYLAEDLKHRRQVAVKVMRPELAQTLGSERFLREVEIAAKLSHPNILPVYDSGEAHGILYYVMPLVEGESLPARLAREKQLPVHEALRIAREVAEALAYAHARGIVHRDIKPANILMNAGHAMVADFGIARAAESGAQALTQTGLAIGTPQYMSPEQASGGTVDGRADIYALGCVLYEMLAGEPPFTGPTAQAIIARSITETPRPLQQTRATLAPAISTAVFTALAKAPADRYATATDMVNALTTAEDQARLGSGAGVAISSGTRRRWWPWAVTAVAAVALATVAWRHFRGGSASSAAKSVAVIPFVNQGPASEAYFADGIVDEVRDKLAQLDQLTVTASASSDQYRNTTKTGPEIARELHVDQVLTGKVSWGTGANGKPQIRVVAELVNGETGSVSWRDTFDADTADAFGIQGRIATSVAGALGTVLHKDDAKALAGRPTQNAEAYDFFLKGQATRGNSASTARAAANFYEQAVALDSNFMRAWGALSSSLSALYFNGSRDPAVARRSKEAMDRVLRLANDSSSAHMVAANYYTNVTGDRAAARRETDRALALDSNNTSALGTSASDDIALGHYQQGLAKLSRARKINPRGIPTLSSQIRALLYLGHYDEAVSASNELMALKPTGYAEIEWVVFSHLAKNDTVGAQQVVADALARLPATELVSYFAGYQEIAFVLGSREHDLLFRMTPAAFDNDRAWWAQSLATAARQTGDIARSRAYADSSLAVSRQQSDAAPRDAQLRVLYAVMLAYAGHDADANREAAQAMNDVAADDPNAPYMHLQLVRVLLATGQNEKAIDEIAKLLKSQFYVTPGYLKVDPLFKPLRGNPRFEQLLAPGIGTSTG